MSNSTVFIPQVTVIKSVWLNDVNAAIFTALADASHNPPATAAQVVANLGISNLLPLSNVWTGTTNTFVNGILLGTSFFDPSFLSTLNVIYLGSGLVSNYQNHIAGAIGYGFASNVFQYTATAPGVGGQFSAYASVTNTDAGVFGVVSQAWTTIATASNLIGAEFAIISQFCAVNPKVGCNIVFKDRPDGVTGVINGLSTDQYNERSIGLWFTSQARSIAGEKCGFRTGIKFDTDALDVDAEGTAIGIDFAFVRTYGGGNPLTTYRMTAAIRFRDFQSILWNGDPTGVTTDPTNPIRTYFDSVAGVWMLSNTALLRFSVNVATGNITLPTGGYVNPDVWIAPSLVNSWVNAGGSTAPAGYKLDKQGNCVIRGIIKSGSIGSAAFVLPSGYRPTYNQNFAIQSKSSTSAIFGSLIVQTDGTVACIVGDNSAVCLDGITINLQA